MSTTETLQATQEPVWTLGERLTKAREHAGISRDEMADRLGVTERTIRNYENDAVRITRATVLAYSAETRVPFGWIVEGLDVRSRCFLVDGHEVHYPHLPLDWPMAA